MSSDLILSSLLNLPQDETERTLAARYSPILLFDTREPFLPLAAGYTLFRRNGISPSFRQGVAVNLTPPDQPPAALAIEYAIWWDWDIGHLYELEHVWVYVDEQGLVIRGDASWHGGHHDMRLEGHLNLEGDHLTLYSEPGKHAFAPTPQWFKDRYKNFKRSETKELAGVDGILIAPYLNNQVQATPLKTRLVHTYLSQQAFEPSWDFTQSFRFTKEMMVPWSALHTWMPTRVNHVVEKLAHDISPADFRFLCIGHRGAAAHAPDNTLLGIKKAAALGADMVELDVRQTADDQVVLSHNDHLVDTKGRIHFIHQSTLAELQTIDLGQDERIPTFIQAVEVCQQEFLGAYIELKEDRCIPTVIEIVRQKKFTERCIVGSFRTDWVMEAKAIEPKLLTSILFSSTHLDAIKLAQAVQANYVHPCWERFPNPSDLLTPEWIKGVRNANLGIICWHEERPTEIAELSRLGVDGICSDAPELLFNIRNQKSRRL